jgi:hypothetical protein
MGSGRYGTDAEGSANWSDRKLLADLARQAVVDFGVSRHRSFRAVGRIRIDGVTATFPI